MSARAMVPFLALLALATPAPAGAQDAGGLRLLPGVIKHGGPQGLAQPLPFTRTFITARDVQGGMTPADHSAKNQSMITKLRGDPGYLAGFHFGQPNAPSRQGDGARGFGITGFMDPPAPIIINNGPLSIVKGNGNLLQQQFTPGGGPVAQQQVATAPPPGTASGTVFKSAGGALNMVTADGNIIQGSPH